MCLRRTGVEGEEGILRREGGRGKSVYYRGKCPIESHMVKEEAGI